jgi:hypothetical protein
LREEAIQQYQLGRPYAFAEYHSSAANQEAAMPTPVLYKYRSLGDWKFVLDIVLNKRLYAAPFQTLNDPMEGRYFYFGDEVSRQFRRSILERKARWRICSLSATARNTLMWSYYADGHKGVALGVTILAGPKRRIQVRQIRYDSEVHIGPGSNRRSPSDVALEILTQKQLAWTHEQEYRAFSTDRFLHVGVSEIVLGCLIDPADRELLLKVARKFLPRVTITDLRRADLDAPFREEAR